MKVEMLQINLTQRCLLELERIESGNPDFRMMYVEYCKGCDTRGQISLTFNEWMEQWKEYETNHLTDAWAQKNKLPSPII
jgi:hypothetical protein